MTGEPVLELVGRSPDPVGRCPFARDGINSAAMAECAGYERDPVVFDTLASPYGFISHHASGVSCRHLRAEPSRRGFQAGCHHPDGVPVDALAIARSHRVRWH